MPTFPAKTNYASGDVLTAAQMVDIGNAINDLLPDAKGSLTTVSNSTTAANLAVGNNGETLVADSSTSTGLRYNPQNALANPVINGGMDVWQRGTSFSLAASTRSYLADRWETNLGANQACTISRQATGDTTNVPNIQYGLRFQRNSGQTGTGFIGLAQSLETVNSIPFAGKTVTLSFYAKCGANFSASSSQIVAFLITGTGTDQNRITGSYTGDNTSISSNITLTTTYQRFVVTGTIPSTATEMAVYFGFTPTGTAGANDWYEVTGVQIDLGTYTASSAPTFRRAGGTLAGELQAAQRYYWKVASGAVNLAIANVGYYSATDVRGAIQFPVTMRGTPTISAASGTDYYLVERNGATDAINSLAIVRASDTAAVLYNQTEAAGTAGHAGYLVTNNASASVAFTAEL